MRSPDFRAFVLRLLCVQFQTSVRSCSEFRSFVRLSCVHVQTCVRSPDFHAFVFRLLCVQFQTSVRSCSEFRAFITRLSCADVQTFERSPDFREFMFKLCAFIFIFQMFNRLSCVHVQTFVRFLMFPYYESLNARRFPRAFIFGLDKLASFLDLNLICRTLLHFRNCVPVSSYDQKH